MKKNRKEVAATPENVQNLRKKLMAALSMLMVAVILTVTTSYAWLVLSIAPEVTGITTNIGANGSLEIALLNTDTVGDKSTIRTSAMGESLANNKLSANETWGNLIDLSDASYGLDKLVLMPARFSAVKNGDTYKFKSGFLSAPTYGYDGRVIDVSEETVTAIYSQKDKGFVKVGDTQDYGVRAIGTSDSLSLQDSALAAAKGNIRTYMINAQSEAVAAIENNDLQSLLLNYATASTYTSSDLAIIDGMLSGLESAEGYIESALRYGMVAYAASKIANEDQFTAARDVIMNTEKSLSELATTYAQHLNEDIKTLIEKHAALENAVKSAKANCTELSNKGEPYSAGDFKNALNGLVNKLYVGDKLLNEMSTSDLTALIGGAEITIAPGSGIFADVADFTGNFSAAVSNNIRMKTASTQTPAYLAALHTAVSGLTAAGGTGENAAKYDLNVTYGYALDLAFRCNADVSNLLLQTAPRQRVYEDSESAGTMGGGSYMTFDPTGTDYGVNQLLDLMNAIRVAFADDQGQVLGVARLNTSNYDAEGNVVKAPLYLYDYEIGTEGDELGVLLMGERRKTDSTITALTKNQPKHITAVVWLDGDLVDNTMVPNTMANAPAGMLNLQFASSADLTPAGDKALLNYEVSKEGLALAFAEAKATYEAGQGLYTTVSWTAFEKAYAYAEIVNNDTGATPSEINRAIWRLKNTKAALELTDQATLRKKITDIRDKVGKTDDVYAIAMHTYDDKTGNVLLIQDKYTQEQLEKNNGIIYRVDYDGKNLKDEGNGVKSRIYTDESWELLATALYNAEYLDFCSRVENKNENKPGTLDWDLAITALEQAYSGLERAVYYAPYDYKDTLFYRAISDDEDTYGLWYYSDFKRVFSDLLIIELNAYATSTNVAEFEMNEYQSRLEVANPTINMLDETYPSLAGQNLIAAHWKMPQTLPVAMTFAQKEALAALVAEAKTLGLTGDAVVKADEVLVEYPLVSATSYESVKTALSAAVEAKKLADNPPPSEPTLVTVNQKQVLAKAITLAQNVEGFTPPAQPDPENPEDANLPALRAAVTSAQNLTDASTTEQAATAIDTLNAALAKFGIAAVTEKNTVTYDLPEGANVTGPVYMNDSELLLVPNVDPLTVTSATIEGTLVTESGVITTITASTTIYTPAAGIELNGVESTPAGGEETDGVWNNTMYQDATVTFNAPSFTEIFIDFVRQTPTERIESVEWSSSDYAVLNVDDAGKVTAVGEGIATVSVLVKTDCDNEYAVTSAVITVVDEPSTDAKLTHSSGKVTAALTNGTEEIASVVWSVDDVTIATIDNKGKLTALKDGTVTVTAKITTDEYQTVIEKMLAVEVKAPVTE